MQAFHATIGVRAFATLKDVQLRLKSVKNIEKITKSMKMIASTKLARAQKAMEIGKAFSSTTTHLFSQLSTKHPETGKDDADNVQLVVLCSSDRGLCGAIHSSLTKEFKKSFLPTDSEKQTRTQLKIIALGDKIKVQLARESRPNLAMSISQISKNTPTFLEASTIVDLVDRQLPLNNITNSFILYNKFISAISYQSVGIPIFALSDVLNSGNSCILHFSSCQKI